MVWRKMMIKMMIKMMMTMMMIYDVRVHSDVSKRDRYRDSYDG